MPDANRLLELIEEGIVAHGGDLGGWTRLSDESLQLFDGRVTLRAEIRDEEPPREVVVHAHVFTTLHEHDDEILDACLCGAGQDREAALAQAAGIWITCVAGPIKSFVDGKPICMTCQAGVQGGDASQGYSPGDYGLPGLRAYVGPSIARGFDDERIHSVLDDTKPWFRFAAESAAPRRVHLAKSTVVSQGKGGWRRELEIDGHEVSYADPNFPVGVQGPEAGYVTRFAVFEFPRNSTEITRRAELERTIRYFAEHYSKYDSVACLMEEMVRQGFDADLVHETETFSMIAFGRTIFEPLGAKYSPTVIFARRDGRIETDVPLMSIPAYTRGRAIARQLWATMPKKDFGLLCQYSSETNGILSAMNSLGDKTNLAELTMFPSVIPDRGVSRETMDAAVAILQNLMDSEPLAKKKPWWKFW